jgi:hypothetical protein
LFCYKQWISDAAKSGQVSQYALAESRQALELVGFHVSISGRDEPVRSRLPFRIMR